MASIRNMQAASSLLTKRPIGLRIPALYSCKPSYLLGTSNRLYTTHRRWFETESGGGKKHDLTRKVKAALLADDFDEARKVAKSYLPDFDMVDKVIIVTGGGRGLGLTMAQACYQAGAVVHCLDRLDQPAPEFQEVQKDTPCPLGGKLYYHHIDVSDTDRLRDLVGEIADVHGRMDGLIAAAGIQQVTSAIDYEPQDVAKMMDVNFTGVFMTAQAVARQMRKHQSRGSIVLVASMSAYNANKGLRTCVYNSSKAAVAQLARNLAMEWGQYNIRVNALCPGNILTPMVKKNFEDEPELKPLWEQANMLGRISNPEEFRGAGIYLLSDASSFVTASSLMVDGGYTAW